MDETSAEEDRRTRDEYHKGYEEYNKSLRTWLVAFGVGGPVLLLTRQELFDKVKADGSLQFVGLSFLSGAILQILIAFINKIECWYCFYAYLNPRYAKTCWGQFMLWLDNQFWIDVVFDLLSMLAFGIAVIKVVMVLTS